MNEQTDVLDSWKEIASFLKRGVRTVQRWERTEGLPVYRHHHVKRGSVYAMRSELLAWLRARQPNVDSQPASHRHHFVLLRSLTQRQAALAADLKLLMAAHVSTCSRIRQALPSASLAAAPGLRLLRPPA